MEPVADTLRPYGDSADRPEPFRLDVERLAGNGVFVFVLRGEVDLHVVPELRERLTQTIDEGADYVVLDLARVRFMDSMALGVVLGASKRLQPQGGQLRVIVPSGSDLRRIFEITMLDRVIPLDESRQEALADFGEPWG
jgi:anti-anti-sigma factor